LHLSPPSSTKQQQITQKSRNHMAICVGPIVFEKPTLSPSGYLKVNSSFRPRDQFFASVPLEIIAADGAPSVTHPGNDVSLDVLQSDGKCHRGVYFIHGVDFQGMALKADAASATKWRLFHQG
jgi:hypothetical protein